MTRTTRETTVWQAYADMGGGCVEIHVFTNKEQAGKWVSSQDVVMVEGGMVYPHYYLRKVVTHAAPTAPTREGGTT